MSSTLRPIGPAMRMVSAGRCGTRPWVGFSDARPQWEAGSRTEPAISVPTETNPAPAATEAPAPADDPPVFQASPQGLRVMPCSELMPDAIRPQSGMVVLAKITAPASRSAIAGGES